MLLFNRYEYSPQTDLIGKGRLARVYKALDKNLNTTVALKIWKTGGDPSVPYILPADRPALISLSHPNIVRYLAIEEMEKEDAFGETETIQVCALERVAGGPIIPSPLTPASPVPPPKSLDVLKQLLSGLVSGLTYLHTNGVAHNNIKVSNILIQETPEGPVGKIADFGAVKNPGLAGKPMEDKAAYEADLQSLAAVFYELFTGESLQMPGESLLLPRSAHKLRSLPESLLDILFNRPKEPEPTAPFNSTATLPLSPETSADDTQILRPKPQPVASDDTQLLSPQSTKSTDTQSDDTQVLPAKPMPAATQSDDTQILPSKAKPASAQSDDTQLLNPKSRSTSSSDDTQLLPPRKEETLSLFSRYEYNPTTGLIGKGGFSRVYKAYDKKLNRWVALKIYKGGEFGDRYSAIAEIRRVVNLDHSNICRYLDIEEIEKENSFGEKEVTQICVMELLDGGNFAEYYNSHKDDKVLKKLLNDVLNGLSYLHKNGIIHRDIKPANILIKETLDGPVAKITDFGISKISDSVNNNSSSALIVSIPYMAPEQLNVKKYGVNEKISYNLDLWSLGVTIYEIVTGKVLFKNSEQDSSEQIMTNIMASELPEKLQELGQPFRDIVAHCIVKDARDRAQKAEELIVLLHSNYDAAAALPLTGTGNTSDTRSDTRLDSRTLPENKAAADNKASTRAKSSFLVDNDTEETDSTNSVAKKVTPATPKSKEQEAREKRRRLISIVSFVVVFLAITLYFLTRGPKKDDLTTNGANKADSATTAATPPAKAPATTPPNTAGTQKDSSAAGTTTQPGTTARTDPATGNQANQTPANQSPANQSAATAEKKPRKSAATTEQQETTAASSGNQKYVLILTTTQSCTVKINQEDYGKLEAGKSLKVFLVPGNYVLQAISLSNSASVYNGNLEVSEKNRSQVGQYKIPLN